MNNFGAKKNFFYGSLLYDDPKIIWCKTWSICECNELGENIQLNPIIKKFVDIEVIWLVSVGWSADHRFCQNIVKAIRDEYPKHKVIFLVNSYEELYAVTKKNIECIIANQNQFLNKNDFYILDVVKKYDAVYNAGFFEYKRHNLASKIKNLVLLSRGSYDEQILDNVKKFENVYLPNFSSNHYKWIWPDEINRLYNESYCGLCLSKTEGAMKACLEYLLSGIPVITTINKGGRDFFLDGRFTVWVDDDPESIAHAVEYLMMANIDPYLIRNETVRKIDHANEIFIQDLSTLLSLDKSKLKFSLSEYDYFLSTERRIKKIR